MNSNKKQRMRNIQAIAMNIMNTFNDENETNMHIDLSNTDPTELITDMVKAMNVTFQELTGEQKNNLEFTYICNQLIFQDALESEENNAKN